VGDDPAPAGGNPPRGRVVPESGGRRVGASGWAGTGGAPEAAALDAADAALGGTPMSGGIDAGAGAVASDGELDEPGSAADAGATADADDEADAEADVEADAASDGAAGLTAGGA